MPSVRVSEHSDLPPDLVLRAARDFSPRRADLWPDVHVEHLEVHEAGETYAEVTEGNPWPIGLVWERLRYDWSNLQALRGTVVDSNLFKPGSTWELWATPENGGSRVEIRAMRHLRGRGWLLAPFFPMGVAASSVREHLKHFLASIEPDLNAMAVDAVGEQAGAAIDVLRQALTDAPIIGIYLYGSAVEGGLRPDSDVDLFVVTDRRLMAGEKARIVEGLLPISGRATRVPSWRPLEVTVVAQPEVRPWRYPPRMELQYGEWLRTELLAGDIEPEPAENPDLGVLITMVRQRGRALIGPPATDVLDEVPPAELVQAMVDGVPSLMSDLADDTRNVLLTLARIWTTVATGEIRSKDEAADWALSRLPEAGQPLLARARDLYRTGGHGEPWDSAAAQILAEHLVREITVAADAR